MLLSKLINNVMVLDQVHYEDKEILALAHDSRKVKDGTLFFCITGLNTDGHLYAKQAYENGARAFIVERIIPDLEGTQIVVEDSRSAMSVIASQFYGNPANKLRLIGITGTNGKTSVTYMIQSIAKACGYRCGVVGTLGIVYGENQEETGFTTPDPIELQAILAKMVEHKMDWVAMEVSAHALDLRKLCGVTFDVAAFTNLTQDHLDHFGDMENYYAAKAAFFTKEMAHIGLINADDEYGQRILKETGIPAMAYGMNTLSPIRAENIALYPAYSEFDMIVPHGAARVRLNIGGRFNIANALTAVGCAMLVGASFRTVEMGLRNFEAVPGRFNVIDSGRGYDIIIDYAHTPDGLEKILTTAKEMNKRVVPIFGCGGDRDQTKRPIMGEIAGTWGDFCIITSDNPRFEDPMTIIGQVEEGIKKTDCPYVTIENRREAIQYALDNAAEGDILVIAGKGAEDYQDIQGVKNHFNDAEIVKEILGL